MVDQTAREIIAKHFAAIEGHDAALNPGIEYAYLYEADQMIFDLKRAGYTVAQLPRKLPNV